MLIQLANHNDDIKRLLEKGYALRVDGPHLVVRDIPYLDSEQKLQFGAIVAKLEFIDKIRVKQDNHQVHFAGSMPHGLDSKPIPKLGGGSANITLIKRDVIVERSFSNKRRDKTGTLVDFPDFYEKIEHYVSLICGPAIARHDISPLTFNIDDDEITDSVFKFHDTLTSRAEIGDLAALLKEEIVAIIGLGGSGSYLLDFMVKAPVQEVRGFDSDLFYVHNAFRSPGKLDENELGKRKAEVYQQRYENFRKGLSLHQKHIDRSSSEDLKGVTFAFVCVDKGSARAEIFDLLIELGIPFIDVGMGLNRKRGALAGDLRTTFYSAETARVMRELRRAPLSDTMDEEYDRNVQIPELNAMNACIAVILYKQLKGFYVNDNSRNNLLMAVENLHFFGEAIS